MSYRGDQRQNQPDYAHCNVLFRAHYSNPPVDRGDSLTEKHRTRSRPVDLDMTIRAVRVLGIQVVLRTCGLLGANTVSRAVTGQTKLRDAACD